MDDESFRSETYVRKRIAGDERKFVLVVRPQGVHIARINDFERPYLVIIGMGSRGDGHYIADLYLPQWAKESITVTRDDHISRLPRQGRAWNMSKADAQSLRPNPSRIIDETSSLGISRRPTSLAPDWAGPLFTSAVE